jgi:hypothetical protein
MLVFPRELAKLSLNMFKDAKMVKQSIDTLVMKDGTRQQGVSMAPSCLLH